MYFRKVLDFQRPKRLICESEKPRAAAHEAAPIYCEFCTDEFQDCKMREPAIKGMDKLWSADWGVVGPTKQGTRKVSSNT